MKGRFGHGGCPKLFIPRHACTALFDRTACATLWWTLPFLQLVTTAFVGIFTRVPVPFATLHGSPSEKGLTFATKGFAARLAALAWLCNNTAADAAAAFRVNNKWFSFQIICTSHIVSNLGTASKVSLAIHVGCQVSWDFPRIAGTAKPMPSWMQSSECSM